MFLNLVVLEFENLDPVWESCLCGFRIREEVYNLAAFEALLDVIVLEEHYLIAIRPDFSFHAVREDYLFLARVKDPLDLAFGTYKFFD